MKFRTLSMLALLASIPFLVRGSSSPQLEQLGPLAVSRTAHVATVLSDGRVLITGGRDSSGTILGAAEIFDPTAQLSAGVASLGTPRVGHTATVLKDGRVLIAGGSDANGPLASAEIFDPASPGTGFRPLTGSMGAARSGHTATLLNSGKVLIAGGDDSGTAEIFDPTGETFSSPLLTMTAPRIGHSATLFSDDSVLLAGGNTDSMEYFSSTAQTFTLDPQKMTAARTGHEAISLSDSRLLFLGGDTNHTIDEFNPSNDVLTLKATMDGAASSATLLANGKILLLSSNVAGLYAPDATDAATAFTAFDETSVPGSTALLRSGQTATELSGDKRILVAGGENAQHQPSLQIATFNPARIWTDKDDYMPDEPVLLFGSGWKANENVYLYAVDSETEQWTYGSTATADAQGSFSVEPYFIVEMRHLGTTFDVSAVGAQSALQANVTFTDAINLNSVAVGQQSITPIVGTAASVQYDVQVDFTGSGGTDTANLSLTWGNPGPSPAPTGVSTSLAPSVTASGNGTLHSTLTITTSSTTPAGSFPFTVTANDGSRTRTGIGTLVVTGGTVTKLAFTTSPVAVTAGVTSTTITVQRQDSAGNPNFVEGARSVTLSSNSTGTVTFSPTTLTIPSGQSSASFTYTDTKAGAPTITAASNSPTSVTSVTQTETVNAASPSKLVFTTSPATVTAGQASSTITVQRQDTFGNPNSTENNRTINLSSNSTGTVTFTPASPLTISNGQSTASFTYTDTKAGTPTITAASNSPNTITSATQIETISVGPASKIALNASVAGNLTAGTTRQLTATIQDSGGNTITTGTDSTLSVTFAKTAGTGNVSASNFSVNAIAGLANITITGTTAGSVTIGASSGALVAGTGNPITFTVVTGALHHFAFDTISSPQTAGTPFTIAIKAQDAGDNTVTSFSGGSNKVMISSTGTLSGGTFTSNAFTSGVLTQSVTITNSGNFTITATGISGNSGITGTSNSFTVSPATVNTTTSVTSSSSPSTYGDNVTFTATVQATSGSNPPTGSVNFTIAGIGTVAGIAGTPTGATATWTYMTSALNAATHTVSASFTHSGSFEDSSGSLSDGQVVNKATPTATLAVSNSPQIYSGSGQSATVSISVSSVPGTVANVLTGGATSQTNAGTYAVTADFVPTDSANYKTLTAVSAGNFNINKATPTATLAVSNSPQTYNGSAKSATVTVSANSVPGTVANILTGGTTTQTNAGTYAVTADFVPTDSTNYETLTGLSAGNFVIKQATPTATLHVTNSPKIYNGSGQAALVSVNISSVPGTVANILTGGSTTQTNANTYAVTADFVPTDTTNYETVTGLSAGNFVIGKADAVVVVAPYTSATTTYDRNFHTAAVTSITGVNGETDNTVGSVDVSHTSHKDAGTYSTDYWFFTGTANYNDIGNTTITDSIGKANATVVVTPYTDITTTYNGLFHTAPVTSITGVNGETGATVGSVDVSNTSHKDAGTYSSDYWFFTGTLNYNNIGNTTITDSIGKANATVVVTPYTHLTTTYDGHEHTAEITSITGVNGEIDAMVGSVDVSNTKHTNAGTYASDYWFFLGTANYNDIGNTTITDSIGKANATVVVTPYTSATTTYDGNFHTAAVTSITGVNGESNATVGSVDLSHTSHKDAGTYSADYWFFTGSANYNNIGNTSITDSIAKANAVVVVTPYTSPTTVYNSLSHTASVTSVTGVNGETGGTVGTVDVSHTTHTDAGTYSSDYWFFTGGLNYNDIGNSTITDSIAKANQTITWNTPATITIGTPLSATQLNATVAGVAGGSAPGALNYTPPTGTVLGAGANQALKVDAAATINYNAATKTVYINVNYTFVGFLQPIDNLPMTNSAKGGQTIPVKWQLKDAAGNIISDLGSLALSGLQSQRIYLDGNTPADPIEELATPGATVFRFDGTQFIFNWQTVKSWAGTSRLMIVTLKDGKTYTAQFIFK